MAALLAACAVQPGPLPERSPQALRSHVADDTSAERPYVPRLPERVSRSRPTTTRRPYVPQPPVAGRDAILRCIRQAEGSSWTSVSPGGTYRGAYQMDRSFWLTYGGSKELAGKATNRSTWAWEKASPAEQSDVAWRGYQARKLEPWPPAQGRCG